MSSKGCLVIMVILWAISCASRAQTISTFLFESPPTYAYACSLPTVGAEGDIWLVLGQPLRLMRVHQDQLACMYETDIYAPWC